MLPLFVILIFFAFNFLASTTVIYITGIIVAKTKKDFLLDTLKISTCGTIISTLFLNFIQNYTIALLLVIPTWMLLIKRLYNVSWPISILVALIVGLMQH